MAGILTCGLGESIRCEKCLFEEFSISQSSRSWYFWNKATAIVRFMLLFQFDAAATAADPNAVAWRAPPQKCNCCSQRRRPQELGLVRLVVACCFSTNFKLFVLDQLRWNTQRKMKDCGGSKVEAFVFGEIPGKVSVATVELVAGSRNKK